MPYRARADANTPLGGNFNRYAPTVWAKRDGEWKPIFYQATRAEP